MRYLTLLFLFLMLFAKANAQQKFVVDHTGAISPVPSDTRYGSFVFVIDKSFKDKQLLVYLADNTTKVNENFSKLGSPNFSKNLDDDNYTITIGADRKIKGCTNCALNVSADFSLVLDNKRLGTFHFSRENPDIEKNIPKEEIYHPGAAITDALYIAANMNAKSRPGTIKEILAYYGIKTADDLKRNNYLKDDLAYVYTSEIQGALSLKSVASAVGGLDVTSIADGFARFIVKRTKEELSIAFFKKFKTEIDANKDLVTLFPKTHALLIIIDKEIYRYSNYINNLREAFRADLNIIDENLPGLIDNHEEFFKKENNFYLAMSIRSACYLSSALRQDQHPGDILQGFPLTHFDKAPDALKPKIGLLKGGIQTLQLFSASLKETDTEKKSYWVGMDKIRELTDNPAAMKIYFGLLIQVAEMRYNKIAYASDKNFYDLVNSNAANFNNDYPKLREFALNFGAKTTGLNKLIADFDQKAPDSVKVETYAKYFKTTVQLLEAVNKLTLLNSLASITTLADIETDTKTYFQLAYQVTDLVTAINRKKYPRVVNQAALIYQLVYAQPATAQIPGNTLKLTDKEKIEIADKVIDANSNVNVGDIRLQSEAYKNKIKNKYSEADAAGNVLILITRYGAFMANMVEAKNSEEVSAAIESVALPVGSSSIKRESAFNVSLNAYAGLFLGNEMIRGVDQKTSATHFNSYGVTAPIGISISKGDTFLPFPFFFIPSGKGWSSSVFLSLVDLGAVAAYRFTDDKTEQVPSIQLKDIFSPGIFWSVGIPKTPLSVNIGTQIGPNLRKVNGTANDYANSLYVRNSISICVDIPLLNLYTKSKR